MEGQTKFSLEILFYNGKVCSQIFFILRLFVGKLKEYINYIFSGNGRRAQRAEGKITIV